MSIAPEQRHTRGRPCSICGGHDGMPRGHGKRCNGFTSLDGKWCFCSRVEDGAHHSKETEVGTVYAHLLRDEPLENESRFTDHSRELREVCAYDYKSESGELLFQVVRFEPKTFRNRRPNGTPGHWIWSLGDMPRVLYRRGAIAHADLVFLTEGEKDADALAELGLAATTSSGGAKGWSKSADDAKRALVGKEVCIIADRDDDGRAYAQAVLGTLSGIAKSVRIVEVPTGKDAADWIEAGATAGSFLELWRGAQEAKPVLVFEWVGVRELEKPLADVPYVCRGLKLSPGAISLFAGYGYSGKTMAAQALLVSVCSGRPVWGLWDAEEGPVGHLDYEQGPYLCKERMQRIARGMGVSLSALNDDRYRLVSLPAAYVKNESYDDLCRSFEGCKVIVVDSFRAACPGVDENSSDARIPLDALSRVGHALGAAIVVIHHARKPSEDAPEVTDPKMVIRGSSAIFDAAQSAYVLVGRKGQPAIVHHVKDRFRGLTLEKFGLEISDPSPDAVAVRHLDKDQLAEADFAPEVAKFDARTRAIIEAVRAGARSSNEVWRRVRGDRNAVLKRVKEMLGEREIALVNGELRPV